eukprot:7116771-Ditylum_brightwellii.AAC.1
MQIDYITKHIRAKVDSGKAADCMLRWAQHCAGTEKSILEDTAPLHYIEGRWVNNIRAGLHRINGTADFTGHH